MKEFKIAQLRNVAIIAHGGAGKTTLAECMLFDSGHVTRLGKVDEGNTCLDFDPDEIKRKITISAAVGYCEWNNHRINIIDTPGYANFIADTKAGLRAADAALVIVSAISGVKVQTEKVWEWAVELALPRLIFVNKIDRERASFERALGDIEQNLKITPLPIQIPMGAEQKFQGVIDLLSMKACFFKNDGSGKFEKKDVPSEFEAEAKKYRGKLVEAIAETNDDLLNKYLDGGELTADELVKVLREATVTSRLVPVLCGSALQNTGIQPILDAIVSYLPSPLERHVLEIDTDKGKIKLTADENGPYVAQVFKTVVDQHIGKLSIFRVFSGTLGSDTNVYNPNRNKSERIGHLSFLEGKNQTGVNRIKAGDIAAAVKLKDTLTGDTLCAENIDIQLPPIDFPKPVISYAIKPKNKGEEDKVSLAFHRILEEDPSLDLHRDEDTHELLVAGMGQVHLEVIVDKLKRKFGVDVLMSTPHVPYRETIRKPAKAQGKYKKQTGGHGQYGDAWLEIEPLPRGSGFEFVDKVVGGVVPRQYIPAVEKGIAESLHNGIIGNFPVVDLRAILYDGSYHPVDSSEMAFKIAGSMAFKKAAAEANPVILEPIMNVEITVPEDAMGEIIGDLNSRRGRVSGVEPRANSQNIHALVPMAEMLQYANDLRSMTSERGLFSMSFSHYDEVPTHLSERIIAEAQKEQGKE
ncbi:MAG: elongation factor G [Candidatus Schekmanbacteria bacterium]|nr:elongation factor G [Candidatus Schekmanbacteria bacterium]